MDLGLAGARVVVTGGASNIGRGIVLLEYQGSGMMRVSVRNLLGSFHDRWVYRSGVRQQLANDTRP